MDHTNQPYVYDNLSSPQSIRLLRLNDAASFDEPIECSIEACELDGTSLAFAALSYTWGSSSRDQAVTLTDGTMAKGTPALIEALRYMRSLQRTRDDLNGLWWIDMICINQDNLKERSQQVALMQDIFQAADTTVVWLGRSGDRSDELMDYLAGTATQSRRAFRNWVSSAEGKSAIQGFQDRLYWKRAWIIQEVCVSRNVLLVCGHKIAPWKTLDASHKWLRAYPQAHSVPDLRILRQRFQDSDLRLGFLIYRTSAAQCTNSRDKIFSILGLVTSGQSVKMVPDYSMSPCSVFSGAIRSVEDALGRSKSGSSSEPGPSHRRWRRANSFEKKYVQILEEVRTHCHEPLIKDDAARLGCDGISCGMWELCRKFSGIALHLD